MSDQWIFYPCQLEDKSASIFYDHGIQETLDQVAAPQLLKVRITLQHPGADGLAADEEYTSLCALEDDVRVAVEQSGALYVGRITVDGQRYLHIFTRDAKEDWAGRLALIAERHSYELSFLLEPDPEHNGYWQDLFPNADDWQVIQDLQVLEAAEKQGDDPAITRPIQHWAYFPTREAAEQFADWLEAGGYAQVETDSRDDGRFCVRFMHEGTLHLPDITSYTIAFRRQASECGGDYDGWEAQVCKSGA